MPKSCQIHVISTLFRANGKAWEAALSSKLLYFCWEFEKGNLTQDDRHQQLCMHSLPKTSLLFFFRFTHHIRKQQAASSTILDDLQKNSK